MGKYNEYGARVMVRKFNYKAVLVPSLIVIVVGFFLMILYFAQQPSQLEASTIPVQSAQQNAYPIHQDPELLSILETIRTDKDLSIDDLKLVYEKPERDTWSGDHSESQLGEPSTIRIRPDIDRDYLWGVIAHEYVHHRYKQGLDEQTDIDLRDKVWSDSYFTQLTKNYEEQFIDPIRGEYIHYEEAMAFGCTALADWRLTPHLISECGKIIDRSKLVQFLL